MTELERSLSSLPAYSPDPQRLKYVREECHAALGARASRRRIESAIVIGSCAAYLSSVLHTAVLLYGF